MSTLEEACRDQSSSRCHCYLAIVGQNGSGKTTLVKHLNGLLKPTSGRVRVFGMDTRETTVSELARRVGYVFQNPDHQIFCATTREEIAFGPKNLGLKDDQVRERTDEALERFDLTEYGDTPPAILGFGLRRKVAVASVYAMRPQLLVLDEPTSGLDRRSASDLMSLVDHLHDEGHTIVVVTHDMQLVAQHCPYTLVMHRGRILLQGVTREVLGHKGELLRAQIRLPQIMRLAQQLGRGIPDDLLTVSEFADAYERLWREAQG